jgi:hypothetical protein
VQVKTTFNDFSLKKPKKTQLFQFLKIAGPNLRKVYEFDLKSFVNMTPDEYWWDVNAANKEGCISFSCIIKVMPNSLFSSYNT